MSAGNIKAPLSVQRFLLALTTKFVEALCIDDPIEKQSEMNRILRNLINNNMVPDFLVRSNIGFEGGQLIINDIISGVSSAIPIEKSTTTAVAVSG